ncbi:MAG: DUF362 domain-containing protein [Candidatus Latescibacterota bacterium]
MIEKDTFSSGVFDRRSFFKVMTLGAAGLTLGSSFSESAALKQKFGEKSRVSFLTGTDRREMVYQSLKPFEKEVEKAIGKKQVVVKVNAGLAKPEYAQYSTHADQIRGILDFLKPIHDRKIIISEGTAGAECSAFIGFENYGYKLLEKEYKVKLVDANDQSYTLRWIRAAKHHPEPINIIDLYTDPNVYLISAARMKTHDSVVATCSLKNVAMGSPVCHYKEKRNEKPKMHGGVGASGGRELSYNIFLVAQMGVQPDLSIIDGIESTEGDGPWNGTKVEHGVMVASTDFVAADRLCSELMGIDPFVMKYLEWCSDAGMGNFDLGNVKIIGPDYRQHIIKYKLHSYYEKSVEWVYENYGEKK